MLSIHFACALRVSVGVGVGTRKNHSTSGFVYRSALSPSEPCDLLVLFKCLEGKHQINGVISRFDFRFEYINLGRQSVQKKLPLFREHNSALS
jgi:hypothetical protein